MARRYAYDDSAEALFRPAAGKDAAAFFEDWTPADAAREELLAAELSRLAYAPPAVVREALPRVGFSLHCWLGGDSMPSHAHLHRHGPEGFIAVDGAARVCVVFRGTERNKPEDLIADVLAAQVPWAGGGNVHRGFSGAYERVREPVAAALRSLRPQRLLFTGHSLGAALATLAAADCGSPARLVSFGAPRVGDACFVKAGLRDVAVSRIVGCCDVVTRVPPADFSGERLQILIGDLYTGEGPGLATIASAVPILASAMRQAFGDPHFAHPGAPDYIDRDGRVHRRCAEEFMLADQALARTEYAATHRAAGPAPLLRPFSGWIAPGSFADFLAQCFAVLSNGTVPLRDLADHAPQNYVSAMAGSAAAG